MRASAAPKWRSPPLPGRIAGQGATRRGGRHGAVHVDPSRCRTGQPRGTGRSRPRPGAPERHRRSGGRGATASALATCTARAVSGRTATACPDTADVSRTPADRHRPPRPALESGLWKLRLERQSGWASIVSLGRTDRSGCRISTRRQRQVLRPPGSSTGAASMPRMAFVTRSIPRRTAAMPCSTLFECRRVPMEPSGGFSEAGVRWPTSDPNLETVRVTRVRLGGRFRATTETFRGICGPQDYPRSPISGPGGVRVGWKPAAMEKVPPSSRATGRPGRARVREGDHEATDLVRDGPAEAVPGGARRGVSEGAPRLACRTLTSTSKQASKQASLPLVIQRGWRGVLRSPSIPWKMHPPVRASIRVRRVPRYS